jgi:hypothetical protein
MTNANPLPVRTSDESIRTELDYADLVAARQAYESGRTGWVNAVSGAANPHDMGLGAVAADVRRRCIAELDARAARPSLSPEGGDAQ